MFHSHYCQTWAKPVTKHWSRPNNFSRDCDRSITSCEPGKHHHSYKHYWVQEKFGHSCRGQYPAQLKCGHSVKASLFDLVYSIWCVRPPGSQLTEGSTQPSSNVAIVLIVWSCLLYLMCQTSWFTIDGGQYPAQLKCGHSVDCLILFTLFDVSDLLVHNWRRAVPSPAQMWP